MSACTLTPTAAESSKLARQLATAAGFRAVDFRVGGFSLQGYSRTGNAPGKLLTVYLEGDGHAWEHRFQASTDPTPRDPVALKLAIRDPSPRVLYLARPCQFTDSTASPACEARYWTSHRYAPELVTAVSEALDAAKQQAGAERLRLVGYSGGGTLAFLLAARRADIDTLVTVAANLDHVAWTRHHGISPLTGSLDPSLFRSQMAHIRQVHYVGSRDAIVPPGIVTNFLASAPERHTIDIEVIDGFDHRCCWEERWPQLLPWR